MAEDKEQKTEKATPRKLSQAREKGQVAKSQDLSMAALLLAAVVVLSFQGGALGRAMKSNMTQFLTMRLDEDFTIQYATRIFREVGAFILTTVLPITASLFVMAILVGIVQVGWKLSTKSLEFKPEKLNPAQGIKKLVNLRSIMRMLFSLVKFIILAGILYLTLNERILDILNLNRVELATAAETMMGVLMDIVWVIALVLIVIGILDLVYQKWQHSKDMMMTKQEVKDENKNTEGDPQIKSRIKQAQRRMARLRMMQDVPKADVVITNPTHAAVALQYDPEVMAAPKVLAKGWNEVALRIRTIAKENGIPIYEEPPLARGLCAAVEIGDEVPMKFYQAVATVLGHVYRMSGKGPQMTGAER